jgi:hypothetical protein
MKTILATAALTLSLGASAFAQPVGPGVAGAIAHFNQSIDSPNGRIVLLPGREANVTLSTRGAFGNSLAYEAIERANQSADGNDRIVLPGGVPSPQGFSTTGRTSDRARQAIERHKASADACDRI